MKTLLFAMVVLLGQSAFAASQVVPSQYLAEKPAFEKSMSTTSDAQFSENVDHLMSVQQESLENINTDHKRISLTQLLTSFTVSKTGLFGLSALSSSSNTTLFWFKKANVNKAQNLEAKTFTIPADEDDLALQMRISEVADYLVQQNKVQDSSKLRENLAGAIEKGHQVFRDIENLETPNWKVGGYRLDLSISASGVVAPFTKVGENARLWLEFTRTVKPSATPSSSKVSRFVSRVLNDTEQATLRMNLPNFELQNLYVGIGEDYKGTFGFGTATFGFVGYVKFVKKPKTDLVKTLAAEETEAQDYAVVQEPSADKSLSKFVTISSKKIQAGINQSLHFAEFFASKAEKIQTTHWELSSIREIATISKSGLFGLSSLTSKGVFVFIFNRKAPAALVSAAPAVATTTETNLSLIRLSLTTVLGYNIPEIANFEVRPNVEFFWK